MILYCSIFSVWLILALQELLYGRSISDDIHKIVSVEVSFTL